MAYSSSVIPGVSSAWNLGSSVSTFGEGAGQCSIPVSRKGAAGHCSISVSRKASSKIAISTEPSSAGTKASGWKPISPWLMLPQEFGDGYKFYSLAEDKVMSFGGGDGGEGEEELVGSSQGWLAFLNKRNHDLFLCNPVTLQRIDLPSIHTLPLNDISFSRKNNGTLMVSKVIVSDVQCSCAMMIFGPANRLAFCCPGGNNTKWTPIGTLFHKRERPTIKYGRVYEDFVYSSKKKLFTCVTDFDIEEWDLRDPRSPHQVYLMEDEALIYCPPHTWWGLDMSESFMHEFCEVVSYLVLSESSKSDQLYLVYRYLVSRAGLREGLEKNIALLTRDDHRDNIDNDQSYPYKTVGFDVFKCDRVGRKLQYLEGSLDGLVMFLGTSHSFALPAADFPELKPDSIYFTEVKELMPLDWHACNARDIGIYGFGNRTFSPLPFPVVHSVRGIVEPAPVWFVPTPRAS